MQDLGQVMAREEPELADAGTDPQNPGEPAPGESGDRRLERVRDYLHESLAKADALAANLGAATSDLMLYSYRLHEAIAAEMAEAPLSLEQLEHLRPAVDAYLRITRQIDRFAHLDLRLSAAQKEAAKGKEKLEAVAGQGEETAA
jgi:hypothetical protein